LRNFVEGRRSVGADGADSTQANNNDQSQHNSVFNCCWTIFTLQKATDLSGEILHGSSSPISMDGSAQGHKQRVNNKAPENIDPNFATKLETCRQETIEI
jgi:hypothetical protein